MKPFNTDKLNHALYLLNEQLEIGACSDIELVVCGGSALIATRLVSRTTQDVDVVALMKNGTLVTAEPLPEFLVVAARNVAEMLLLPDDWLNNGPASQLTMGVPSGFVERLQSVRVGSKLTVHYISREDQVYFKTFASADRGGYHIADLRALQPTDDEMYRAALWCMEQDVSEGFRFVLREMLKQTGWSHVSERI